MANQDTNQAPKPLQKPAGIVVAGLKYRRIVILLSVVLIAFGIYALIKMDKNEFPSFTIREGVVAAVYPGATPEQMEQEVLKPLEDYVFSYKEVNKKKTYSQCTDGMVMIFVELDDNIQDATPFWNEFKLGMDAVKLKLPSGVLAVETISNFGDTSSLLITMQSDQKTYRELGQYMDDLRDRLRTIESVGTMDVYGKQGEQIAVTIDPEKLTHYALNEKTLGALLLSKGFQTTGGSLRSENYTQPIHVDRSINSVYDLEQMIIMSLPGGSVVRLGDVATVKKEYADPTSYITNNGTKCILLSVQMKDGYNIVQMGREVNKQLAAFNAEIPSDVSLFKITDQPEVVNSSVDDFLRELVIAIVAVVVVIMLLLPFKVALIAASTIPIAIFISLGLFYMFGIELNTVTLACLILSLGMIVDNSVVIIDDYVELISEGMDHKSATLRSGTEFLKAIFSATLAISITFFPFLLTMTGMFRDFLTDFPWALTIILMVSLIVAELLVPFLQYKLIKQPIYKQEQEAIASGKKKFSFFVSLQKVYNKLITVCFNYPRTTLVVSLVVTIGGILLFVTRPVKLMPIAERNQFAVEIFLPTGTSVNRTSEVADSLEAILAKDERVVSIASFHGCSSPRFQATYAPQVGGPNFAQFIVNTKSDEATIEVLNEYTDAYESYFPDAIVRFKQLSYSNAAYPIEIRISGRDFAQLQQVSDSIMARMRQVDGLRCVRSSLDNPLVAAEVVPNAVKASRLGQTNLGVEATLAMRYSTGVPVATVWEGDYGIPVVLKTPTSDESTAADLLDEPMPVALGATSAPLRQFADVEPQWNHGQLSHRNGIPEISIMAEVQRNVNVIDRTMAVMDAIDSMDIPDGVTITRGGDWDNTMTIMPQILEALVIAVVIIFFIILFHYAQINTALLMVLSLLLCIPGAGIGMLIQGVNISLTCVLGIVSLMGILVRNAIVLLDYAEELRNQGETLRDAIFKASQRRMRPIFLTSAAATMGVVPMVIGGSALWQPMGVVIFYGTPITMIFILTTIPVAYWKMKARQKGANSPLDEPLETHMI
ncbi:MAG: efflux RND transporter permease subunit [Bacteroides sp.]|nr:efflux RND transporter permease subunit [Bacteroides sp.]MBD5352816.1 efflux RND transporter permease subunit [Bacteroides sp.]MBD5360049.1 efflux RND transporter permease subunit [Bacteroides sp.]MBD5371936.1 efflux RND transporter permease subunit [Bacteroides sp.]